MSHCREEAVEKEIERGQARQAMSIITLEDLKNKEKQSEFELL